MEARNVRLRACEQRPHRYSQRSRDTDEEVSSSKHDLRSVRQQVDQMHGDMTNWTSLLTDHTDYTTLLTPPPPGQHRPTATPAEAPRASAGQPRRTSPGAASAAGSAQTRHVSPVRADPVYDGVPLPSQP
eukprot:1845509-Pyramimonas_sp.AAC.1